jgi:glycosyltransferase involved in cell wall biosynthesis
VPHGVDLAAFDSAEPEDVRGRYGISVERPVLVYHGIYGYPPNLEAMQVMAQDIMPRLHSRGVHPVVLAIGRCAPGEALHPDLIFTGSVERIAPFLLAADVAVVPLLRGGGTRMKVLDYFAARVPVVSTAKGIEGIPVTPGLDALVEDDYDAFADAIVSLLRDRERARAIAQRGRALVESLDWVTIARRYREVLGV